MLELLNTLVSGTVGALLSWWLARRDAAKAEEARRAAEKELETIRRRARAPLYLPSEKRFNRMYVEEGEGRTSACLWIFGNLLCLVRSEVQADLAADTSVIMVVDNVGQAPLTTSAKLDGEPIVLGREAEMKGSNNLEFLRYRFRPEKRGMAQRIEIEFLATDGVRDTHIYHTEHGRRVLRRVDPD